MISSRRSFLAAAALAPVAAVGAAATAQAAYTHDYDQWFTTPVNRWPSDGSAPAGYRSGMSNFLSYRDGSAGGMYYPSKVLTIHDGVLDFHDHQGMGAALLPFGYTGFRYGTLSVRMCVEGSGFRAYHNAFLLWPDSGRWPGDGEIDFCEGDTAHADASFAVHPAADTDSWTAAYAPRSWLNGQFHTYTLQRGPGFVNGYQSGRLVLRVTRNLPYKHMHPVLQSQWTSQWTSSRRPPSQYSGHTLVSRITFDHSYTVSPSNFT